MAKRTGRAGRPGGGGFTIPEAIVATVLVGIGIVALVGAAKSGTQVNAVGRELTQATYLLQAVREWTLQLPFSDPDPGDAGNPPGPDGSDPQVFVDDLDDLMDVTYSPPRDASGQLLAELGGWSQHIQLEWKDPDALQTTLTPGASDVVRVVVTVARNGRTVLTGGWLVTRR